MQGRKPPPKISIIVPVLNEIEQLPELMEHLQFCRRKGCEVLIVDGGSDDGSADVAEAIGFTVVRSPRGRACQMNAGAALAKGQILVFLHADTRLPQDADHLIITALALPNSDWGRFDVSIAGGVFMFKVISWCINQRSRLTGIATGDQAIFVTSKAFEAVGGFPQQPLMEDIELSRRLRRLSRPKYLKPAVTTSARRWLTYGIWRTIWNMWALRWAYWRGVSAERLVRRYQ
jgi:rSAM/selenodomain-associated transferase 2